MSCPPVSKMIGLVRRLDGSYEPTNDNSLSRLTKLLRASGLILFGKTISDYDLADLRFIAPQFGYHIVTTRKTLVVQP